MVLKKVLSSTTQQRQHVYYTCNIRDLSIDTYIMHVVFAGQSDQNKVVKVRLQGEVGGRILNIFLPALLIAQNYWF
jgi:hypothetical protein